MTRRFGFRRLACCVTLLLALARLSLAADDMAWPDEAAPPPRSARARPAPRATRPAPRLAPAAKARRAAPPAPVPAKPVAPPSKPAAEPTKAKKDTADNKGAAQTKNDSKRASKGEDADDEDDDDADVEVESVDAAPATEAGKDGNIVSVGAHDDGGWTLKKLWAHMHAAVIHLPIAWLMAWAGCEAVALVWPHPWLLTSGLPLGLMTAVGFAPSVYSGLMRLEELAGGESGYDSAPALLHRNLRLTSWTLVVLALALRLLHVQRRPGKLRTLYLALVFSSFLLTAYSAHLGGIMVYGDDFFPF